jgi:ATP-dependent Lhr-like helicase
LELEREGSVLRGRFEGQAGWCNRRLLARIHRYTLDRLRKEIEPVTASEFLRFLTCWQHVDEEHRLEGPRGVSDVVRQLAGLEVPALAWEANVLPTRVRGYRREWLDELMLSGEIAWGRVWGSAASPIRTTPLCLLPREDMGAWLALSKPPDTSALVGVARELFGTLSARGAMFPQELARECRVLPSQLESGISELISRGVVTCDSYAGVRSLLVPASRRRPRATSVGRWSLLRRDLDAAPPVEMVARQLLRRTGVTFRRTVTREKHPFPWRDLLRALRTLEARGEVRGGRFVAGFDGEQYALPEAVSLLRAVRRRGAKEPTYASAADPLNFRGILTPDERVSPLARQRVLVA